MKSKILGLLAGPMAAVAMLASALAAAPAHATPIVGPVSVSASIPDLSSAFSITNLINQSGLSASYVSGVTDFSSFVASTTLSSSPSVGGTGWASTTGNSFPAFIDFNLGAMTTISRMALWNDTDVQALGAFEIFASADATFTSLASLGTFTGAYQSVGTLAQVFDIADATTQYIRISGAPVQNVNGLLNIGEFAFEGTTSTVPESGTLALLGLGLAGLGLRRRRMTN